eukprot:3408221-Pleurochrysis_carterae.AAC.1
MKCALYQLCVRHMLLSQNQFTQFEKKIQSRSASRGKRPGRGAARLRLLQAALGAAQLGQASGRRAAFYSMKGHDMSSCTVALDRTWNEGSLLGCPVESLPCERQAKAVRSPLGMLATSHAAKCDVILSLRPNH